MKLVWITLTIALLVIVSTADAKRKRKFEGDFEFADEDDSRANNVIPVGKPGEKKKWIHDPDSDLCQPLKCKKKEICLLEDEFTAVCVSKKELHKNGDIVVPKAKYLADKKKQEAAITSSSVGDDLDDDEDDMDEEDDDDDVFYDTETDGEDENTGGDSIGKCTPCPIVKPTFLCGSNNKTFSSLCRLDYHNCIHQTKIKLACKGFCPCKETEIHLRKKQKLAAAAQTGGDRGSNLGLSKYKYTNVDDGSNVKSKQDMMKLQGGELLDRQGYMDKYMFVPKDFKFDNQHYKYIKYMKHDKQYSPSQDTVSQDKDRLRGYNEAVDMKPAVTCNQDALQAMGDRLLDWFSVIQADAKRRHTHNNKPRTNARFPPLCRPETRWMFHHLDSNSDSLLSLQELYDLEHDQNEKCIKPFLDSCDTNRDIFVSPHEWCHCFETTDRPCTAIKRRISNDILGAYMPECDAEGYYHHTQCHASVGMCWCVDKHGVEYPSTRTRGKPNCEKLVAASASGSKVTSDNDNDEDNDDEDEDDVETGGVEEGSGEQPLDF
uniref:Testican-1 n=1 Tax=Cacopsylla melanoneura TaxID=428564 RepID=A0A8D8UMN9_9HEMI